MNFDHRTKDGVAKAQEFLLANRYDHVCKKLPLDQIIKYIHKNTRRMVFSMSLLPALKPGARVLEIGAIPYCFSTLLIESFACSLTSIDLPATIFPGEPYSVAAEDVVIPNRLTQKEYLVNSWTCNAEKDRFPLSDKTFDAIICTEVLEHLLYSPAHVLKECRRTLKDGGLLLLSTVNSLHYKRMVDIMLNENIDDVHSAYGPYVRHNRNWSRRELVALAEECGFGIRRVTSATLRGTRAGAAADPMTVSTSAGSPYPRVKKRGKMGKNLRKAFLNLVKLLVNMPLPGMKEKRHYNIFLLLEKRADS